MTYKVGPKGQVVLPKRIRELLGIRPGDAVTVDEIEGEIRIRKAQATTGLRGLLKGTDADLVGSLEADHRWEIEHDERRMGERDASDDRP
jgi:AbrB family looped-hinge helix DNA binding protein